MAKPAFDNDGTGVLVSPPRGGKGGQGGKVRRFPWRLWVYALLMTAAAGGGGYFAWTYRGEAKTAAGANDACQASLKTAAEDAREKAGEATQCKTALTAATADQAKIKAERDELSKNLTVSKDDAAVRAAKEKAEARARSFDDIIKQFAKMIGTGELKVVARRGNLVLSLPAEVLFPSGVAELSEDDKKKIQGGKDRGKGMSQETENNRKPFELVPKKRFNLKEGFFLSLTRMLRFTGAIVLIIILIFVAYNGIQILSWEFITQPPVDAMTKGGIFPVIMGTILLTVLCMIVVIPIGLATAIFLTEYSKTGLILNMINMSIYTLAGVPSVVFGLFGLAVFVVAFNFGMSLSAGSMTLAIMVLPYIISTSEEAIKAVPHSFREASLACGATKWQTIKKICGSCRPGKSGNQPWN